MLDDRSQLSFRRLRVIRSQGQLLVLSAAIGVLVGLAAILFRSLLHGAADFFLLELAGGWRSGLGTLPRWSLAAIPAIGALVTGLLIQFLIPHTIGKTSDGTDASIDAFHNRRGRTGARVPFLKGLTSIITIATGGSAGVEGPISQVGSGIGSQVSRLFRISAKNRRILTLAGMAAGLGAIFKAPLGGALTAVEVIYKNDFESDAFLPSIVASVMGYVTFCSYHGYEPLLGRLSHFQFGNPWELLIYALLGVLLAIASRSFIALFNWMRKESMGWKSPFWFNSLLAGATVGFLAYLLPEIIGGGWEALIGRMQSSSTGFLMAGGFLILAVGKMIATALTVGVTQSGGLFGPSLFIGGMFGGAFGHLAHLLWPTVALQPSAYVLVGMGAFFAGVAQAPIAVVVMVCELAGDYSLLAPLMIASAVHIALSRKESIYQHQVKNKFQSPAHRFELRSDLLRELTVREVLPLDRPFVRLLPETPLREVEELISTSTEKIFLIADEEDRLLGIFDLNRVRRALLEKSVDREKAVREVMNPPVALSTSMDLHQALQLFLRHGATQMAVLEGRKVVGVLHQHDLIAVVEQRVSLDRPGN